MTLLTPEEYEKWAKGEFVTYPYMSGFWSNEAEPFYEPILPFEQDENGFYGYKVLIRMPGSQWFWSPNRLQHSEWVDNRLTSHVSPLTSFDYGIYGTKDVDSLRVWYDAYNVPSFNRLFQCYIVRIRVWGDVVEHSIGFRAQHAEIMEILDEHW